MVKCRKVNVDYVGHIIEGDHYGLKEYWGACYKDTSTGPHDNELRGAFLVTDFYKNYCYTWSRSDHYQSLQILNDEASDIISLFGWLYKESIVFVGHLQYGSQAIFPDDVLSSFEISIIIDMLQEAKESYALYDVPKSISFDDDLFRKYGLNSEYSISDGNDIDDIIDLLKPFTNSVDDAIGNHSYGRK